jgi:hypothetical protein
MEDFGELWMELEIEGNTFEFELFSVCSAISAIISTFFS